MKISGNKFKLFKRDRCVLPEHLINKDNVFVNFDQETGDIDISFSEDILREFSYWGRKRVNNLMKDLKTGLTVFYLHQPWNFSNRDKLYDQIFVTLHQVY